MSNMLSVRNLTVRFGGITAVDTASFDVAPGQTCGLIGPNGAGKTTAFNAITGIYQPSSGTIELDGSRIDGRRPHQVVESGVGRTFQNLGLFESMSVVESVLVGTHILQRRNATDALIRPRSTRRTAARNREWALKLLDAVGLTGEHSTMASALPFGSLKRLELARALASKPRLLLLDEPANGLSSGESVELATLLASLRIQFDLTMVIVEHHMPLVLELADHLVVMDAGRVIAAGEPRSVVEDPRVIEAYLGAPV